MDINLLLFYNTFFKLVNKALKFIWFIRYLAYYIYKIYSFILYNTIW